MKTFSKGNLFLLIGVLWAGLARPLLAATISDAPPWLTNVVSGTNLILSWPSDHIGWTLQFQTNITGVGITTNWNAVTGSSTTNLWTLPIDPANDSMFSRLAYQIGQLFSDDFTRTTDPGPLTPWVVANGYWTVTGGVLAGGTNMLGTNALATYGDVYIINSWGDYTVQAQFQFPAGAFGGGLGGRLNPTTGSHYAAWIYPEGSSGGSSVLKLVNFQNWTTFNVIQTVNLVAGVGTSWHTLTLGFSGTQITVSYDSNQLISVSDSAYASGAISLDMWTDTTPYVMAVDNVVVTSAAGKTNQSITFGPLANKSYGDPPFTVNATASSGLPVTFSILSGPATIAGSTVTVTGTGTVTVEAAQSGNSDYNAATPVDQSFAVGPAADGTVFADNFAHPGSLSPWAAAQGNWAVTTNNMLQGTNAANGDSFAYVAGNWTNYTLQGQIQFSSSNGYGGGLGGYLQSAASGAHYGAWVYPEGSAGGSNVLKLVKFEGPPWGTWNGTTPMATNGLPGVGTNWHTLKLAFLTNQISVYYDGLEVLTNVTDHSFDGQTAYLSGGITADMYTDDMPYVMSVSNVTVKLIQE